MTEVEDPAPPSGAAAAARQKLTCEFCECHLAADGSVLRASGRAKELGAHETTIEKLTVELARVQSQLATITNELTAAKKDLEKKSRFW